MTDAPQRVEATAAVAARTEKCRQRLPLRTGQAGHDGIVPCAFLSGLSLWIVCKEMVASTLNVGIHSGYCLMANVGTQRTVRGRLP